MQKRGITQAEVEQRIGIPVAVNVLLTADSFPAALVHTGFTGTFKGYGEVIDRFGIKALVSQYGYS